MSANTTTGYVYFIGNEQHGFVKIGMCGPDNGVDSRLKALQTGCPFPLSVFAVLKCRHVCPRKVESDLHKAFSFFRASGEWFRLTKVMKLCLESAGIFLCQENRPVIDVNPVQRYAASRKPPNQVCSWEVLVNGTSENLRLKKLCRDAVKSNPCKNLVGCLIDALEDAYRQIDQITEEAEIYQQSIEDARDTIADWSSRTSKTRVDVFTSRSAFNQLAEAGAA